MSKSKLRTARWIPLRVISVPFLMVFATHTKQNTGKHETHTPARQNTRIAVVVTCSPAESCSFQLSWTLRKALNYLNIDLWCHLGRCRVSGMTSSCGFRRVGVSHGLLLKSSPQLCVSGLATLENFKCLERPIFWKQAPAPCVASYGKYIFSASGESPSVRRLERGKISSEAGLLLQL